MRSFYLASLILVVLSLFASPVSAGYQFGVGDGLALVLFIVLGVVAVCALLGWIARRRAQS